MNQACKPLKICYLSGGRTVPSVRFRLPFFAELSRRGHTCHILHSVPARYEGYWAIGWRLSQRFKHWNRKRQLNKIRTGNYDLVVLETALFNEDDDSLERELRSMASRIVYEIDDAVFLHFPQKTEYLAAMADRVIVANKRLEKWAIGFNERVTIVPTCVDDHRYQPKWDRATSQTPRIGWIGSTGNIRFLQVCASALRRLSSQYDFTLEIIAANKTEIHKLPLAGVQVQWIDINKVDEVAQLQQLDIGIGPLPGDDPWMEFKGNAKMIQYMALGLPTVGSAIGFNLELVQSDRNGLLATTEEEWYTALQRLITNPELRRALGKAAYQTIEKGFTVTSQIDAYEQALCS